jgi:DNA primase
MAGSPTMFYNRIMFPIVDSIGNIIAFTGRVIDQGEPKYLNTPETKIFNKSKVLYGLNWARQAIKERDSVILVEGQTDVIFCQANGFINTIASSGTALTEEHLKILSRLTPNILLAYDQDMAGQKATKRAFEMAIELDLNVKIIEMPEGQDPADMIKNKPEEWKKAVSGAQRVIDYYLNRALKSNSKPYNVESKKKIAGEILPLVKIVVDPIEQSHYVQLLSQELGTSQSVILEAIGKLKKGPEEQSKKKEPEVKEAKKLTSSENLLGILIVHADLFKKYANALDEKMFDTEDSLNIYNVLKKAYTKIEVNRDFNVFEYLKKELPEELVNRINLIIFSLEEIGSNDPQIAEAELEGLILRFKLDKNSKLKGDYARQIAEAIKSGNRELAQKLNKELDNAIKKN